MTRDGIITEVMAETKRTDKQSFLEDVFPDVIDDMCTATTEDGEPLPLQDLKATAELAITDGDYYVALPSDFVYKFGEPELLYNTDKGRILKERSLEWMNTKYPNRANNTSNKSKPFFYCMENNRLDFAPMSDGSYTINFPYTKLHPTVSDNSVTILFKDFFKPVIKDWLKSRLWELLDDEDKRDFHYSRGLSKLRSLSLQGKRNSEAAVITECNDL